MASPHPPPDPQGDAQQDVPLGQRLFDNVFLWLVAGIAVMAIVYTGWGLYEILSMPPATLP
ncbi:MAG: hypothetical protein OEY20_02450 [Gemmatimonadota bacterium]|nr:hypothetical protein [Gemmatimonadota bacterium]MDH5196095.1 hypothetical protein [Gemmatimonadota bacterium]